MEVELDLFNYASKSDLKGETDINTSEVAKKNWFSWLKIR